MKITQLPEFRKAKYEEKRINQFIFSKMDPNKNNFNFGAEITENYIVNEFC